MSRWMRRVPITTDRGVRRALTGALLLLLLLAAAAGPAGAATTKHEPPVGFKVAFGDGAHLGASTALDIRLRVSSKMPLVNEVRLLTPAGIDLSSSGLGRAECRRPAPLILAVMNLVDRRPCPVNALMGSGVATAELRFDPQEVFDGAAQLAVYAGETYEDKPGLIVIANAHRPVRTQLTYQGYLYIPPPDFGVGMAIKVKAIPQPPFGAPVALASFHMVIGAPGLRYVRKAHGRSESYHPRAIPLPGRCPAGGFRFRAIVRFDADPALGHPKAERHVADAIVPCPQQ
jgi:hypothetical protein